MQYTIGGAQFVADNKVARGWPLTKPLDLRTVVLVVRVAQFLKREWDASVIYWGGLGTGRNVEDRHVKGFAMDFHGAVTRYGEFNVWRDWGAKRVPKEIGGDPHGKWPAIWTRTSFRLDSNPLDFHKFVTTAGARKFFFDLYEFLTTQAAHGSSEATPRIGQGSSILHPDTPYSALRAGHQDHFHFEIAR